MLPSKIMSQYNQKPNKTKNLEQKKNPNQTFKVSYYLQWHSKPLTHCAYHFFPFQANIHLTNNFQTVIGNGFGKLNNIVFPDTVFSNLKSLGYYILHLKFYFSSDCMLNPKPQSTSHLTTNLRVTAAIRLYHPSIKCPGSLWTSMGTISHTLSNTCPENIIIISQEKKIASRGGC